MLSRRILLSLALALGVAVSSSTLTRADKAPADTSPVKGVRVFTCAHSFHNFVASRLDALAKREKVDGHSLLGTQMIGGSRVKQHWDLPEEKNKARAVLATGKVDVLTLSPHVYLPDEGIDRFVELARKHNPKARVLVQLSWHPWDSLDKDARIKDNAQRDKLPIEKVRAAQDLFKKNLEDQVKKINAGLDKPTVFIVPVGDAVVRLRELVVAGKVPGFTKQSELFTDAIGHARPVVMDLATYCYFAAIYNRKPTALPANVKAQDKDQVALYRLLQDLAWETVKKYPLSGVSTAAESDKKKD